VGWHSFDGAMVMANLKKVLSNNGLLLVFGILFLLSLILQAYTGWKEYSTELEEYGQAISLQGYLGSGHFIQATFENWESEFLQMALFVVFTIFLRQKGSSESKGFDGPEPVDRKPRKRKDAPWPVHRGGWILELYKHSLSIVLFLLFVASFFLHAYGSLEYYNAEQVMKGQETETMMSYMGHSRFWFESFQNWQSEFLSIVAIVVLSIYLRQQGSPQSKPVDAPHSETGE
jgi:hypothetical protein